MLQLEAELDEATSALQQAQAQLQTQRELHDTQLQQATQHAEAAAAETDRLKVGRALLQSLDNVPCSPCNCAKSLFEPVIHLPTWVAIVA